MFSRKKQEKEVPKKKGGGDALMAQVSMTSDNPALIKMIVDISIWKAQIQSIQLWVNAMNEIRLYSAGEWLFSLMSHYHVLWDKDWNEQ